MAQNGVQTRSNRSVVRRKRMGTLSEVEGCEDHLPYDQEDRLWPPSPRCHPPLVEPQAMPRELVSPYD